MTLLPTPTACVANDGEDTDKWLARRERVKATAQNGNGMGMPLTIAVQLLPTPRTSDTNGAGVHGTGGLDLRTAVPLLPTPRATDGTKGGPNQRGSKGDLMLPSAVHQLLPTPTATDVGRERDLARRSATGSQMELGDVVRVSTRWGDYAAAIARHEQALGRPAPNPTEPGPKGSPRLSARFTEWMMRLPDGWISDVPGITRIEALRLCGNGVVPPQAAAALRDMKRHITPTQEIAA